ncbi:MAG: MoaD/ThiS family protein [Candidatus Binatia bacterium]
MADTLTISVKLFATLKRYLPAGSPDGTTLTLPQGATVADAVDALEIPRDHAGMLVAGDTYVEIDTPLTDGQELNIFPPLAGGAY